MNEKLKNVLIKKYTAEIEDAKYKINCYSEQELIIPEHPDITGEVDKLLEAMSTAEEKSKIYPKTQKCIRKSKSAKVRGHSAKVPRRFCEG